MGVSFGKIYFRFGLVSVWKAGSKLVFGIWYLVFDSVWLLVGWYLQGKFYLVIFTLGLV